MATEVSTNLTTVTLPDLQRGTTYRVRVAGNTAGGLGDYTQYVEGATLLDRESHNTIGDDCLQQRIKLLYIVAIVLIRDKFHHFKLAQVFSRVKYSNVQ